MGFLSGALGSIASGALSYFSAKDANSEAKISANKQMGFQAEMSNTAHQRAMADLRAAGLNPILAARSPASTPGGAQYQPISAMTEGVNSAMNAYTTINQGQQTQAQTSLTKQQEDKVRQETIQVAKQHHLTDAQAQLTRDKLKEVAANIELIKANEGWREAITAIPDLVGDIVNSLRDLATISNQEGITSSLIQAVKAITRPGGRDRRDIEINNGKYGPLLD